MTKTQQAEQELKEAEKRFSAWTQVNLTQSQIDAMGPLLNDYIRKTCTLTMTYLTSQLFPSTQGGMNGAAVSDQGSPGN